MRRPEERGSPDDGDGLLERAEQLALLTEALTAVADSRRGRMVLAVGEATRRGWRTAFSPGIASGEPPE